MKQNRKTKNARSNQTINRKVYSKDHDENLDEVIDQRDTPIYAHIDKPLALESYPRTSFSLLSIKVFTLSPTGQL